MDIGALYQRAKDELAQGQFKQARDLGHQLLKARFSGAYEILAKSFHLEGQLELALKVLESGVQDAPEVWLLWLQLGNYRSEARDLNGAVEAYAKARALPAADKPQIDFNEAFLRLSFNNKDRGLELLEGVIKTTEDKKLKLVALKHRLTTLIELDRVTEALMELGEAYLHDADNAELLTTLAFKLMEHGDRLNALNLAKQALGLRRAGTVARVVRLLQGEVSEKAGHFVVTLAGKLEDEDQTHNFRKVSKVYADSEDEAVELARNFEPPDLRAGLKLLSVRRDEGSHHEAKGVDWSGEPEYAE